jgi:hypothetical protein
VDHELTDRLHSLDVSLGVPLLDGPSASACTGAHASSWQFHLRQRRPMGVIAGPAAVGSKSAITTCDRRERRLYHHSKPISFGESHTVVPRSGVSTTARHPCPRRISEIGRGGAQRAEGSEGLPRTPGCPSAPRRPSGRGKRGQACCSSRTIVLFRAHYPFHFNACWIERLLASTSCLLNSQRLEVPYLRS